MNYFKSTIAALALTGCATFAHAQQFIFPTQSSSEWCYDGNYSVKPTLTVTGILIKDVYYDKPETNEGSFSFEVIFSYHNEFYGTLPTSAAHFWTYQVTFRSSNPNVSPSYLTNNLPDVKIGTQIRDDVSLENNDTYYGSLTNMGLTPHTLYTDHDIINLFKFEDAQLSINLPCISTVIASEESIPLAVNLIYFNAVREGHHVLLKWQAASEKENTIFDIERSADGKSWSAIGVVRSDANAAGRTDYSFTDPAPSAEGNHYRLKMTDDNGETYAYSHSVYIPAAVRGTQQLYPNPAQNELFLSDVKAGSTLSILDFAGNIVDQVTVTGQAQSQRLDVSRLPNGSYFILISEGTDRSDALKFTVLR